MFIYRMIQNDNNKGDAEVCKNVCVILFLIWQTDIPASGPRTCTLPVHTVCCLFHVFIYLKSRTGSVSHSPCSRKKHLLCALLLLLQCLFAQRTELIRVLYLGGGRGFICRRLNLAFMCLAVNMQIFRAATPAKPLVSFKLLTLQN